MIGQYGSWDICNLWIQPYCEDDFIHIEWGFTVLVSGMCSIPPQDFPPDGGSVPLYDFCDPISDATPLPARYDVPVMAIEPILYTDFIPLLDEPVVGPFDMTMIQSSPGVSALYEALGNGPKENLYPNLMQYASTAVVKFAGKPPCGGECESGDPPVIEHYELVELGGCRYLVRYNIQPSSPECPVVLAYLYYSSDEESDDDMLIEIDPSPPEGTEPYREIEVIISRECGRHASGPLNGLALKAIDACGCEAEDRESFNCCICFDQQGEECPNGCDCGGPPSGLLTITPQEPDEDGGCLYLLSASGFGDCETAFIEFCVDGGAGAYECDRCLNPEDPNCSYGGGPGCQTISDGTYLLRIFEPELLKWRVWDGICGCYGPWTDVELPCANCTCCEEGLSGLNITLSGIVDGLAGCGDCAELNGEYFVPLTSDCGGDEQFISTVSCNGDLEGDVSFEIIWTITCEENNLILDVSVGGLSGIISAQYQLVVPFVGDPPRDCLEAFDGQSLPRLVGPGDGRCSTAASGCVVEFV